MEVLTLKHAIQVGKKTIDKLTFRDYATAEDLLAFDNPGATRQTIELIASLTGTDTEIVKRLHVTDFRAADAIASQLIKPEATEKNAPAS